MMIRSGISLTILKLLHLDLPGRGSTSTILEEYIFDIRAGSPTKDATTASNVLELLQSLRFLSQTFDEVDTSGEVEPLVAFAKVYLEPEYDVKLREGDQFKDANDRGVSYFEKAPFQLRVGHVNTASGRVVVMGVCSSLDSLNEKDTSTASLVPDNLPMCSSESGMGTTTVGTTNMGTTPMKRPRASFEMPATTPATTPAKNPTTTSTKRPTPTPATGRAAGSRRPGRLAALHFQSD